MKVKKGDFIEIEYVGRIKETNQIFDLTNEETAKENKIHNPNATYGPLVICVGDGDVIKGLDESLVDKEFNKEYTFEISPETAFGKKDPRLMKIFPTSVFRKKDIAPIPGLQVNMDGLIGTIKTVSGGRSIIDFNHPLSGRTVIYNVKINRKVTKNEEKLDSIIRLALGKKVKTTLKEGTATIEVDLPDILKKKIEERIKKLLPSVKKVGFSKTTTRE